MAISKLSQLLSIVVVFFQVAPSFGLQVTCGPAGRLSSFQTASQTVAFEAPRAPTQQSLASYRASLCVEIQKCFSQMKSIGTAASESMEAFALILAEMEKVDANAPADLNEIRLLNERLHYCQSHNRTYGLTPDDSAKPSVIAIDYPFNGPNRGIRGSYDKKVVTEVIQHALGQGADPYLALAILALEAPPVVVQSGQMTAVLNAAYREDLYGTIPVDAIAMLDQMGCVDSNWSRQAPHLRTYQTLAQEEKKAHSVILAVEKTDRAGFMVLDGASKLRSQIFFSERKLAHLKSLRDDPYPTDFSMVSNNLNAIKREESKLAELKQQLQEYERKPEFERQRKVFDNWWSKRMALVKFQEETRKTHLTAPAEFACVKEPNCYRPVVPPKTPATMDLGYLAAVDPSLMDSRRVCSNRNTIGAGDNPSLNTHDAGDCCVSVRAPMSLSDNKMTTNLMSAYGARYIKGVIQSCVAGSTLEHCAQRYNGLGCLGCTEKLSNRCLNGIVMADRPVYGARAIDAMLNSFMSNPEINKLISAQVKASGRMPTSSLCMKGQGTHEVSNSKYLELQRTYLLDGDKTIYQARINYQLRQPTTDDERAAYLATEQARRENCSKLF